MPVIRRKVSPVTNNPLRHEDVGRLYGLAAATLYRLLSKSRFDKRGVQGRTPCAVLQQPATKPVDMKGQPAPSGTETIAIIECLDGGVFVFNEALIADIGPYYEAVDLEALIIDLSDWYATHPAKRSSRSVLLRDIVNRLAGWTTMAKYQRIE